MSWAEHHMRSEPFASSAEAAARHGDHVGATALFKQAAEHEEKALKQLDASKVRTLGITAVSAASLWYKASELRRAETVAAWALTQPTLPTFAREQLQGLLQAVWNEQALASSGLEFAKGELLVSVSGGKVVAGGAPMDLILRKVDEVGRIFFRTIEMLLDKPLRRRGDPSPEIQDQFRPWLFQAPAGSYQFAVRVEKPRQMSLFPGFGDSLEVDQVAQTFLEIVKASSSESEGDLASLVSNADYREVFLKLTRNLAPRGTVFSRLEMKPAGETNPAVVLLPETRSQINQTLRENRMAQDRHHERTEESQLKGTLRGLQLDSDWIEVSIADENPRTVRVYNASEVIDDLIGPMVNHTVLVTAILRPNGKYQFRDIQLEE